MLRVYTEVEAQDDKLLLIKTTPHFHLLPMSKVDQSQLRIHAVPPLQYPKSLIIATNVIANLYGMHSLTFHNS